jgi:hypothetical protein
MPILSEDIKLLKSAVMADTSDGGGAMTGNPVVDGQSNNMFPDLSPVDTAFGVVNIRGIFGVAHSNDVDPALGMHAIITDAADEDLVQCTLIPAPRWGAQRDEYRQAIEKYLSKGPLYDCYVYEAHFAGTLLLRLFARQPTELPKGGETIVIRRKSGQEQYVRVVAVTSSLVVSVTKLETTIAVCELGTPLEFDIDGQSAQGESLPAHADVTSVYSTAPSFGAKFYGIKPLAAAASAGDTSLNVSGGIYTPVVPSTTAETAIVDDYPLQRRVSLSRTSRARLTLPAVYFASVVAGTLINAPTAMEPSSVQLVCGSSMYTDNGAGALLLLGLQVGTVDYRKKVIQFSLPQSSGGYQLSYKPATLAGGSTHSAAQKITAANQGLVFTNAFEPPPAPGTFAMSYMVQGNWYELLDNGAGRLSGADTSHGVGTLSYSTGSAAATLGAVPDIGSAIIYQWGDTASARDFAGVAPARLQADLVIDDLVDVTTLNITWSRGAANYTATCSSAGVLQGDAQGSVAVRAAPLPIGAAGYTPPSTRIVFSPNFMPSAPTVNVSWVPKAGALDAPAPGTNGAYTLPAPIALGSLACQVGLEPYVGVARYDMPPPIIALEDDYNGHLRTVINGTIINCGTINYTTGAVVVSQTISAPLYEVVVVAGPSVGYIAGGAVMSTTTKRELRPSVPLTLRNGQITTFASRAAGGAAAPTPTQGSAPTIWYMQVPVEQGLLLHTDGVAMTIGGEIYTSRNGTLQRGWDTATGVAALVSAGTVTPTGRINVAVPPSSGSNAVTIVNAAVDYASGLATTGGAFRTSNAPLKAGVFQIQNGAVIGNGSSGGVITGGGWYGTVDYGRGIVQWSRVPPSASVSDYAALEALAPLAAEQMSYNAVYLKYLPISSDLLGIDTTRMPIDGKVPIYRVGDMVVVHNTQPLQLPNPLVKGVAYTFGRTRVANVRVKAANNVVVPSSLYSSNMDLGQITVPVGSDITALPQPWTAYHRVEDLVVISRADISGKLSLNSLLTHAYPSGSSYVSSALVAGDVFGRVTNIFDQATWTGEWSSVRIGSDTLASYNSIDHPVATTNKGAVTEQWVLIFASTTAFRIVGEHYGQIGLGDINTVTAPINTATGVPFFTLVPQGWGQGWAAGNVLRLETIAAGMYFGVVRTVLQGTPSLQSDSFTVELRLAVNA